MRSEAFHGGAVCASLGDTAHITEEEQEYRSTGQADISRIPFARLYSQVLDVALLFSHPRSKMEIPLQKAGFHVILKETGPLPRRGKLQRDTHSSSSELRASKPSLRLLRTCS